MQFQREILDAIRKIVRSLRVSSRQAESNYGLSGAQLFVLSILQDHPSLSINDLAEKTKTHQSSVSTVVAKLAQARLVKRVPSKTDRRSTLVALTPEGERLLKKPIQTAQEKLFQGIESLSASEQKALAGLLSKVLTHAQLEGEAASLFFEEEAGRSKRPARTPSPRTRPRK